jgi:hypothetical protein
VQVACLWPPPVYDCAYALHIRSVLIFFRLARAVVAAALVFVPIELVHAQQVGTLVGRVIDSASALPRRAVAVSVDGVPRVARTDADGRFTIARVPAGAQTLRIRQLGYDAVVRRVDIRPAETTFVAIALFRDATVLGEMRAEVRANERESFSARPELGALTVTASAMKAVPRVGEADPVRVVQLLPGVQARNDFSTGLNVRGGESDQNLVLLDGIPIYNPFHLGGMFSTFIGSSVGEIRVMTAAFPAQYGDRLSAVLDVHSQEDLRPGIHGTVDLSVVAASGTFSGSFAEGRGTWSLAGRRTYADAVAQAANSDAIPYHFRDEHAHATYELSLRTRLSVTVYDGRDLLDGSFAQLTDSSTRGAAGGAFRYAWGNLAAGASITTTLDHPAIGRFTFGDSLRIVPRVYTTRFSTALDIGSGSATLKNQLHDSRVSTTLTSFTGSHDRSLGVEIGSASVGYSTVATQALIDEHGVSQRVEKATLFADDLWRISPSLLFDAGARLERVRERPMTFSPRAAIKWLTSDRSAYTLAAGHYTQWMHSLSLEDNPIHLYDIWQASDANAPVSESWQVATGHERWLGATRLLRVEVFDKRFRNLLEYVAEEDPRVAGDDFRTVDGRSYGADIMLRQLGTGALSGWLSYTWQKSERWAGSERYAPAQDRRHDWNAVLTWRARGFITALRAGYASGMPYTEVIGNIERRWWDPFRNEWGTSRRASPQVIGAARNSSRMPATRRVDLFAERPYQWRGMTITPFVSIVNAINAHNVLYYRYDFFSSPAQRQGVSQLPFFPSAGVTGAF